MPKLPIVKAKDFYGYLLKYGCIPVSTSGSHFKVSNPKTAAVAVVPIHGGRDLSKHLFAAALSQLGIDVDDFLDFMDKN